MMRVDLSPEQQQVFDERGHPQRLGLNALERLLGGLHGHGCDSMRASAKAQDNKVKRLALANKKRNL